MTWTTSFLAKTVVGNQRKVAFRLTADAATQTVATGLSFIEDIAVTYQSCSTGGVKVSINSSASGVATPGSIGCSGFASGDVLFVSVYGH